MTQLKVLYAEPFRLVMIPSVCTYCTKSHTGVEYVEHQQGILRCDEHKPLAQRDVRAYLYRCGKVNYKDAIDDPLFKTTELLDMDIKVRRSSGVVEDGWRLAKPFYGNRCLLSTDDSGNWYMIASFNEDEIIRGVLVRDLKMVLPLEKHGLVEDFIGRLVARFYKAEQIAYEAAIVEAEAAENPSTTFAQPAEAVQAVQTVQAVPIYTVNCPGLGIGRVLIPPSLVTREAEPVASVDPV